MGSESTPTSIPRKVALVLGGGGAKGAYHVGVQKALSDRGYTRFTTIAGTSVGALNAVLFETASPSESREVWMSMADFARRNKNWQKSVAAWAFLSAWALIPMAIYAVTLLPLFIILDDVQQPGFASRHYSVWPIVIGTQAMLLFSWSFNYGATMIIGHKDRVLGHLVKVPFGADLINTLP
jgi:predicted acylesterase/phospholipase RssA